MCLLNYTNVTIQSPQNQSKSTIGLGPIILINKSVEIYLLVNFWYLQPSLTASHTYKWRCKVPLGHYEPPFMNMKFLIRDESLKILTLCLYFFSSRLAGCKSAAFCRGKYRLTYGLVASRLSIVCSIKMHTGKILCPQPLTVLHMYV